MCNALASAAGSSIPPRHRPPAARGRCEMPRGSTLGDIAMAIVFLALATSLVAHKNTASDITAAGNAFSGSIKAATG